MITDAITPCPDCGIESGENYGGEGYCWECYGVVLDAIAPVTVDDVPHLHEGGPGGPPPMGAGPVGHPGKLRVLDMEWMLTTEPPPVPWVVEPMLAAGCVTMLAGREGRGKSMFALALAAAIGHGATVAGLACTPGKVLYIDAENGARKAHRRVRGLGVKPGTLVYVEAVGFNPATDFGLVTDLVREHKPTAVVIDSFRSTAPGLDENDSRPVEAALRPVSRAAQEQVLPFLILHHAGRQSYDYRGSTAIGAAVEIGARPVTQPLRSRRRRPRWSGSTRGRRRAGTT